MSWQVHCKYSFTAQNLVRFTSNKVVADNTFWWKEAMVFGPEDFSCVHTHVFHKVNFTRFLDGR